MTQPVSPEGSLKVAIIGGGPAGLAAAIALSKRPFVDWKLYEKKPEISEIGNGISIQPNTWRMLEKLGASRHLKNDDFFRPLDGHFLQHRNGRTGELEAQTDYKRQNVPPHQRHCRAHRAKLQQALLREVNQSRIRVGRKLVGVVSLDSGRLRIRFDDGVEDEVDLLVGADGIRSVVRQFAFPSHNISYTGSTCYRTLVRTSDAEKINGLLPKGVTFWHGTDKKWVYTCPLAGDDWEITCAIKEAGGENRSSWGKQASVQHFTDSFAEMCQPIQELFKLVTYVEQYDYFAGPRLESVIRAREGIVLIGDASHPLSGAFGAGAGFALEDAYVLAGAVEWAATEGRGLADGLRLFDGVRSPHYKALYAVLDEFAAAEKELAESRLGPDEEIQERIRRNWGNSSGWMQFYRADKALEDAIQATKQAKGEDKHAGNRGTLAARL